MPSSLTCSCGKVLHVCEGLAGHKARCPVCRAVLLIPKDEPRSVEEEATKVLLADSSEELRTHVERADPGGIELDEPDPIERPLYKPPPRQPHRKPAPARIAPERPSDPPVSFEKGWFGNTNAGMVGGLLMMIIAVVWFVVGMAAGLIFIYPPILFVLGFIALIKGLASRQ